MKQRKKPALSPTVVLLTALMLAPMALPVPCTASQIDDGEPINISLRDADLAMVLESFARVAGGRLETVGTIEGLVTVEIEDMPWRKALATICDQHELVCRVDTAADGQPLLRVDSGTAKPPSNGLQPPASAAPIDISLRSADLVETLTAFGHIAQLTATVDPALTGTVTLEVESRPWTEVIEEICRLEGCQISWTTDAFAVTPAPEGGLSDQKLDVQLAGASVRDVVASVAAILRQSVDGPVGLDIDPVLERLIDLRLDSANWQETLDAVCRAAECTWAYVYGDERVIRLQPANRDLVRRIDLDLGPVPFEELAAALSDAVGRQALLMPQLDRHRIVDLDLDQVRFVEAADEICRRASCRWDLTLDGSVVFGPAVRALAPQPPVDTPSRWLSARLTGPDGTQTDHTVRLSWIDNVHVLETARRDTALILSWLPFTANRQVAVATLVRCDGEQSTTQAVKALKLPLRETIRWRAGDFAVALSTPTEAQKERLSSTAAPADRCGRLAQGRIDALLTVDGTTSRLNRSARPGLYWMLAPASASAANREVAQELPIAAAIVILGSGTGGAMELLRLVTRGNGEIETERISLGIDQKVLADLPAGLGRLELRWTKTS